ncbi:MAG TPA: glycoside hydrolase domain-containing protein [Verrucomicrobiae bacterium]
MVRISCRLILACVVPGITLGQNLVPNPSFEEGTNQPAAWESGSNPGRWEVFGHSGSRGVSLTDNSGPWRTVAGISLEPNQTYVLRFWGMATNANGAGVSAELQGVGGRRVILCDQWLPYALALVTPTNPVTPKVSLSQPSVSGTQFFDDVEVTPSVPVHARTAAGPLGVGESLRANRYLFQTRFAEFCGNYSRPLLQHASAFGGDEWGGFWGLGASGFIVYRHALEGTPFSNARIKVTVSYSFGGDLALEVSGNGGDWQELKRVSTTPGTRVAPLEVLLPANLLPAAEVAVRLRTTGTVYLSGYEFEGELAAALPDADGETWFFEQQMQSDSAAPVAMANTPSGHVLTVALRNPNLTARTLAITCRTEGPVGTREKLLEVTVPAGATNEVDLPLPSAGAGENMARVEIRDAAQNTLLMSGALRLMVAATRDDSFGARLPGANGCELWWCGGTYKVGRARAVPAATNAVVQISAARNEYEPFQLVLRPETTLSNVSVTVSDFTPAGRPGQSGISATNFEIAFVEYVNVTRPTDGSGTTGPHPDPLVPLNGPFTVPGGVNQPLWFTVFVPPDTPTGDYEATITLQAETFSLSAPLRLHVHDFTLPEVTHTLTAYHPEIRSGWHNATNLAERQAVYDLYLQNFRRHRVSPYAPHLFSQVVWYIENGLAGHDFTRFDAAMTRYLDEFQFNGFNLFGLKAPGLPEKLDGAEQFTPQYGENLKLLLQPIMTHLRERGWADRAYCFWYDEPQPSVYPFVQAGMRAIQAAAPGLRRVLTLQPDPALYGDVDLWLSQVGLFRYYHYEQRMRERLAAGDGLGWYLCLAPTAPRPNNFIDHPAINHRVRFWLAPRYGISSDFYWNTTWYMGPNNIERNPWEDPMSMSGPLFLGNGDGMLLYPPVKTPPTNTLIAGPINSLRWELLREGLEDGEYFWLLNEALGRAELRLGPAHPSVVAGRAAQAEILRRAPSVSGFERDPEQLQLARQAIAEAIEAFDDGTPMIVNQPRSRAAKAGETVILRVEALGWPTPVYQWRLEGTNLPGATTAQLVLTNWAVTQAGAYSAVASNARGSATSAVAQVENRWSLPPRLIANPADVVRPAGETAIFTVTAVSGDYLEYVWLRNDAPLADGPSLSPTLVLTNLTASQAGDYRVVVTNEHGAVTSAVARLTVVTPVKNISLITGNGLWRYHDLGTDLGDAWRQPDYDDSSWSSGYAILGYGNGDEDTVVGDGQLPNTVYFRRTFTLGEAVAPISLTGHLLRDDGAVIYLNGVEIYRTNMPDGEITFDTSALGWVEGVEEWRYFPFTTPANLLRHGTNVLAVEVHQHHDEVSEDRYPVATWPLNESSPPWADTTGTNDFLAVGTEIVAGPGKYGGCVSNRASSASYLVAASAPGFDCSGPFTVGGWFAFGAGTSTPAMGLEKTNAFSLYYTGTTINRYRFEVNGATVQDQTSGTAVGQWRFVVGWFDGTNINIQVDNGTVYSATATAPAPADNPLIALRLTHSSGGLAADELFFYRRVLSPAERTTLYQHVVSTNASDLAFDLILSATVGQVPQLLSAPVGLARRVGEVAAFTVGASSVLPLTYQWHFGGAPLAGATSSLLYLGGVTLDHAGAYSVTVSNAAGAITTTPVQLTVIAPELRATLQAGGGSGCSLEIPGYGVRSTLLVSSNLVDWEELVRLPALFAATNYVDAGASNAPSRFYRLRLDP